MKHYVLAKGWIAVTPKWKIGLCEHYEPPTLVEVKAPDYRRLEIPRGVYTGRIGWPKAASHWGVVEGYFIVENGLVLIHGPFDRPLTITTGDTAELTYLAEPPEIQ